MQKQEIEEQQEIEVVDVQLNQYGRPKQKVILYQLTQQMKKEAKQQINKDLTTLSQELYIQAQKNAHKVWDKFYQNHKCNFFKDRTYLERQLPEITDFKQLFQKQAIISNYVELGCGVGNTLFPLIKQFNFFKYYGCDISAKAINLIKQEIAKRQQLQPILSVEVCDLVKDVIPYPQTGDLASLIFVLSAIAPEHHSEVIGKVVKWMKPGSFLYFRDYGRYDFGQLNLSSKGNRKLKQNFYMKNDGVCVYYFEAEQIQEMFTKAGLVPIKVEPHCKLLQNRKTGLKMYRVWIQGRFYKPPLSPFFEQKTMQRIKQNYEKQKNLEQHQQPKNSDYN